MTEGIWIGLAMAGSFAVGFYTAIFCITFARAILRKAQEK
jgi:hypothetical protein